jgi:pSer/pThr/pTyr-binding forkhead associated (FHA) protein
MPAVGGATVRSAAPTGPARQPMLQIMDPWGRPAFEYPLQPGRVMIGREQADLPLTQDPTISRWHASLLWRAGALTLEDMASTNGVFLRIADAFLLEDGDEFALGLHRFVFLSTSPALRYKPEREVDGVRLAGGASAAAFPRLMHLLEGGVIGGLYPLGERFHIGNKQGELVCPDDMSMSGTHAVIERRQHAFYLRDLASALGSYIRINSPVELLDGDSFLVGRTRIAVRLP